MSSTKTAASKSIQLLSPVWTHLTTMQPTRAAGIYLYDDVAGTRYTDFTCGIGVTNTGHCHASVVQAIQRQAETLIFGQMNIVIPPVAVELAERLNAVTPPALNRFFFSSSGAEAVEASVKLARHATGKQNVIVFQGSFHGRTHQTMAMTTAKYIYRVNYQPLPSGIVVTPFPHAHYYGWDEETTVDFCLRELQTIFKGQSKPDETAAIIIEPVLGEGGYVPTPPRFMQELRRLCTEHGILLIADEVQSGFGRTGKLFAFEHYSASSSNGNSDNENDNDVEPDILVMAKGLGSGMPISGIASRHDLMDKWIPGSHGGTYGGGTAVAAAAAVATLDVIEQEGLLPNAVARGHQLQTRLKRLQRDYANDTKIGGSTSVITDVRGVGLMVASEMASSALAKAVQKACVERHLLIMTCGTYENVLRWIPPLIVTETEMDEALDIFEAALEQAVQQVIGKEDNGNNNNGDNGSGSKDAKTQAA